MEGQTSNPWLIAIINMTIVFGVLIVLGWIVIFVLMSYKILKKRDL